MRNQLPFQEFLYQLKGFPGFRSICKRQILFFVALSLFVFLASASAVETPNDLIVYHLNRSLSYAEKISEPVYRYAAYRRASELYFRKGDSRSARRVLLLPVSQKGEVFEHEYLAKGFMRLGASETALFHAESYHDEKGLLRPEYAFPFFMELADIASEAGDTSTAAKIIARADPMARALEPSSNRISAYARIASSYYRLGVMDSGLPFLKLALAEMGSVPTSSIPDEKYSNHVFVMTQVCAALVKYNIEPDTQRARIRRLANEVESLYKNPALDFMAATYASIARDYLFSVYLPVFGFEEAIRSAEESKNLSLLLDISTVQKEAQRWESFRTACEAVVRLHKSDPDLFRAPQWIALARAYAWIGDYELAHKTLAKADAWSEGGFRTSDIHAEIAVLEGKANLVDSIAQSTSDAIEASFVHYTIAAMLFELDQSEMIKRSQP